MVSDAVQRARDSILELLNEHGGGMSPSDLIRQMSERGYTRSLTQSALQLALSRGDVSVNEGMDFAASDREAA